MLADYPDVIPTLTEWYILEWKPYYGNQGPGDAKNDLISRCNHEVTPIGLVAMEDNKVCGTIALDLDTATNLTPSVVGLLVGHDYRRRGIATALLESAEDLARRLDYNQIYISTTILGDLLTSMDWYVLGEVEFLNAEKGSIYVRDL